MIMPTYIWEQSSYITDSDGRPVLIIIGRDTTTNKTKSFGVRGFAPYFYVEDTQGDVVSCYNTKLRKIECKHPQEVHAKRQYFESTFDADVSYDMRYLIDNDIYYAFDENLKPVDAPVHLPRVLYYDIEIYIKDGSMPDPSKPDWEIVSISCRDSYSGKMRAFTLTNKKVNKYQICCKDECDLLNKFMDFIIKTDFDVMAGWYSSGFDWPYITNRAKKLRVNMDKISRIPTQRVGPTRVPGRILADMLDLFKDWSKPLGQQPAYDLKSISKDPRFGGFAYADYGESIPELIASDDWETLVQYSLNDVISLATIDEKCGIFKFYEGVRHLAGIKLDDCLMKTRIIETFLMRNCKYPLPTRKMHEKEDFEGAYVVQPTMGIHEWVGGFDLAALYPTIIVAYNISPDAFNMIPTTIVKMMAERERLRAMRLAGEGGESLATTEQSLKYIINSFYGVMGYKSFKLFDMECAKRIPALGQQINKGIHAFLSSKGFTIDYGDTDSSYISPIPDADIGLKLQSEINDYLTDWAISMGVQRELAPRIKLEEIYRTIFFKKSKTRDGAAKKRYAGHVIWTDSAGYNVAADKLDIKGFEVKRSDQAQLTKDLMNAVFKLVLIENKQDDAISLIKDTYFEVWRGERSIYECAIPSAVKSDCESPHLRGKTAAECLLGVAWQGYEKPQLLYCKRPVPEVCIPNGWRGTAFDDGTILINWPLQADKIIRNKMETIMTSLGYSWATDVEGQRSLADFM